MSHGEQVLRVHGGIPLTGTITVGGSRKASLALVPAALLATGEVVLEGISTAQAVEQQIAHLAALGAYVQQGGGDLHVHPTNVPQQSLGHDRSPAVLLFLGPLLARYGRASVPFPGPSETGPYPTDLHLRGLAALGARSWVESGWLHLEASHLRGAEVFLDYPGLTATQNIMLAATGATGRTTIRHAARDPEVVDLATFLMRLGAHIRGAGTDEVVIEGGKPLGSAVHRVMGDRHEAALYLAAAVATQGSVTVRGVERLHMLALLAKLDEMGAAVNGDEATIAVTGPRRLQSAMIRALPYPGFPSDFCLLCAASLVKASGTSIISDATSPDRMLCLGEMRRLGVKAVIEPGVAVLHGDCQLTAATVRAHGPDSASALVIALLAAEGNGLLEGHHHLATHFPDLARRLASLGAQVSIHTVDVTH